MRKGNRTDVAAATTGGTPVANPVSHTTYADDNVVYRLDSPDKLEGHVGHSVTVEGVLKDDVDKSKVTTDAGKTTARARARLSGQIADRARPEVDPRR